MIATKWFVMRGVLFVLALCFSVSGALAQSTIQAVVGRAKVVNLRSPAERVAVGDPRIADFTVISPTELYVLGKAVGVTNIIHWDMKGRPTMFNLAVGIDVEPLEDSIRDALPNEKDIRVTSVANTIVLNGYVNNVLSSEAAVSLSDAYARNIARNLGQQGASAAPAGGAPTAPAAAAPASGGGGSAGSGAQVINLLKVRDAQQVMLEVRIAEISKGLFEKVGINFFGGTNLLNPVYAGDGFRWAIPPSSANGGLVGWLLANTTGASFDLEKTDGLIKILAAPTIMAISGQEGSFLVGGKVFLPVQSVSNGTATVTLQEQDYGVGLKFVPTVLDKGRINLKVAPEVSELSKEPVTVVSSGVATVLPTFFTRKVSTTVQLAHGESLVIGGFFRNNVTENVSAIPVLGQIPILGALFRSSEFRSDRTELVVVVRPTLVEGTPTSPPLPTDSFIEPSRSEFFLEGRLEGRPPAVPSGGAGGGMPQPGASPSSFLYSH